MFPLRVRFLQSLAATKRLFRADPSDSPRRWMRRHWRLTTLLGLAVVGMLVFDTWLMTCGFDGCPDAKTIRAYRPPEGGRVNDRFGKSMGRLNYVRRVNVPLSSVPKHVRQAFIATEDRRFYSHEGLDWRGVSRAVVRNTSSLSFREGFSTITMQVARNTFLNSRMTGSRSLGRKFLELRVARLLERALTKDQILELYLNVIYLGNGVYGVEGAARDLFGKRVRDLTIAEGAMLAALPKGPSVYTPRKNPGRAIARRNLVLALMQEERYLSSAAFERARRAPLPKIRLAWRAPEPPESYVLDMVRAVVDSVLRSRGELGTEVVVHTTLDATAQRVAQRTVQRRAVEIERETSGWWGDEDEPEANSVQGAMVALDPRTGDIRALVGGRTHVRGSLNRAVRSRRQPGSAFKPFVYAAALNAGLTPASVFEDAPVFVDQGNGDYWSPANYDEEYAGRMTMRRALMRSSNTVTVRVSRAVGEANVVNAARANGIASPLKAIPSLALGAIEVTPLELVTAYAPFANGGVRVTPRIVRRIERMDGTVLWSSETRLTPVMDPRDAFQMTSMLRGVVDAGTGNVVRAMGIEGPIAGKTGTTNDGADTWFVGYTPVLVAGFWFGYDTPRTLGGSASGARMAAPAWVRFYRDGWKERGRDWDVPDGLVAAVIDPETGALAGDYCPIAHREWFRVGTEPRKRCEDHEYAGWNNWILNLDDEIQDRVARILRRWGRGGRE
ncbi:MAG TPA: PBP1A family penicillin-binding protein [Gemmatimonadaceae bacterium]|nr:PBP1A family penicillin-binding protein [Gemmatimonadaceae bacterium]